MSHPELLATANIRDDFFVSITYWLDNPQIYGSTQMLAGGFWFFNTKALRQVGWLSGLCAFASLC